MTKFFYLITLANQFITDRDWWQFHNPKNDAMNIIVETGELAEHFIERNQVASVQDKISEEISDVLFGVFCFSLLTKVDIVCSLGTTVNSIALGSGDVSYEQVQDLVLQNLDKFHLNHLTSAEQVVFSLIAQVSQLADIFVWCTPEQSVARAQEKNSFISAHIACIIAHLIYLSHLIDIDLPKAYTAKMQKNGVKYPLEKSSGHDYIVIKDASRGRSN